MHDYMRAMKDQFCKEAESPHRREVGRLHSQLTQRLSRKNRRLLLHLMMSKNCYWRSRPWPPSPPGSGQL